MNATIREVQVDLAGTIQKHESPYAQNRLYSIYDSSIDFGFDCLGSGTELDPIIIIFNPGESFSDHLRKLHILRSLAFEKNAELFITVLPRLDGQSDYDCIITSTGRFYLKYTVRYEGAVNDLIKYIQYYW